jgi:hypothetical protein
MRIIHTLGYAFAALFAAAIGTSFMGNPSLVQRIGIALVCAVIGGFVGWKRKS